MNKEKTMYIDIETSHCLVATYGLGKQYVAADQVLKERKILVICYKWEGSKTIHKLWFNLKAHNRLSFDDEADKSMLRRFEKAYCQADLIVAHNGRKFDIARLRARMATFGLSPLPPTTVDDSYKFLGKLDFTSKKLDYLARLFKLGRKQKTDLDLWLDIVWKKDATALKRMVDYCAHDVLLLEKVYKKLLPHAESKFNRAIHYGDSALCPACGGLLIKKGFLYTSGLGKKQRKKCTKCGKWSTCGKNLVTKPSNYFR